MAAAQLVPTNLAIPTTVDKKDVSPFESHAWSEALRQFRNESGHSRERLDLFLHKCENERSVKKMCVERRQKGSEQYGKVMSNIASKIDIFIRAGNVAVKAAPESIGLAWTGVSLVLGVFVDHYQNLQLLGSGCTAIIGIMTTCRLFTKMFSIPKGPEDLHEIQAKIIEEVTNLYGKILEFSYQAWKYAGANKAGGLFNHVASRTDTTYGILTAVRGLFWAARSISNLLKIDKDVFESQLRDIRTGDETLRGLAAEASDALGQTRQEEMMGDLKDIKSILEESSSLSRELARQLEEQRKRSPMDVAKETFERQKKNLDCRYDDEVLQRSLDKKLHTRGEGTCQWIFDTKAYKHWLGSATSELLFIHGGRNMGKSVLVSTVIESLQKHSREQTDVLVQFFFCRNGDDYAQLTDRIFRQILYALYEKAGKSNLDALDKCNETVKHFLSNLRSGDNRKTEEAKDEDRATTFDEAFRAIASKLKKKVFLIIDALDECADRERHGFISTIRRLSRTHPRVKNDAQSSDDLQVHDNQSEDDIPVKILISGRPEKDILTGFESWYSRRIEEINIEKHNQEDILDVVRAELTKLPDLSAAERDEACNEIVRKANSSFGYVQVALDSLRKPWRRPLAEHLKSLPEDLLDMNARIFTHIDPSYVEFLKTCLTWAILANGNQKVRIEEVVDAYSRVYLEGNSDWNREALSKDEIEFYRTQIQVAGGTLLEVDPETREIGLIKPAIVKDSFLKERVQREEKEVPATTCDVCRSKAEASKTFTLTEREGHLQIALTIFKHLNSPLFQRLYLPESINEEAEFPNEDAESTEQDKNGSIDQDEGSVTANDTIANADKSIAGQEDNSDETVEEETIASQHGVTDLVKQSEGALSEASPSPTNAYDESETSRPGPSDESRIIPQSNGDTISQNTAMEIEGPAEDDDDVHSDVDSDISSVLYAETAYEMTQEAEQTPRYELCQYMYHLQQVERLWKNHDKPEGWNALWNDVVDFFESKSSKKCISQNMGSLKLEALPKDYTPLMYAVAGGLGELTRRLLEKGADPMAKTSEGFHALHFAARLELYENQIEICHMLLEKQVNPNQETESPTCWISPFHMMLLRAPNIETTKLFLEHGADISGNDGNGVGAIHYFSLLGTDPAILELLVEKGAEINAEDADGETPLHWLVRYGCSLEMLEAFLNANAEVNKDDRYSLQPLSHASSVGNLEVTEVLLKHNADVHDKDEEGMTALHYAARHGHAKVVSLLVDCGADPALSDNEQRTPFFFACGNGDLDTVRYLAKILYEKDPSLFERPSKKGKTPFRKACGRGKFDAANFILEFQSEHVLSIDINAQDSVLGRSALHAAAYLGFGEIVELLISRQASIGLEDKQRKTALRLAYENWHKMAKDDVSNQNYEQVILRLIEADHSAAVADTELLHHAAIKGSVPILKALLHRRPEERRADPNAPDEHGWTAVDHARQYGQKEAERLLLERDGIFGKLPSRWKSTNEKKIMVSEDGLEIWQAPGAPQLRYALFSEHPIPSGIRRYYYEVTFEPLENTADVHQEIAFGVSHFRPTQKPRLNSWMPGLYCYPGFNSWGYWNNGWCTQSHFQNDDFYDLKYATGDTVGCAVDFTTGCVFFTKNGCRLIAEKAFEGVGGKLHCVIGLSSPIKAKTSFSPPFMWKPANEWGWKDAEETPTPAAEDREGPADPGTRT